MRRLFAVVGLLTMVTSCGFNPQPKDGKLPCDHGCPSGYVCRADNRCWHANAPTVGDSGVEAPAVAHDVSATGLASADGPGFTDGALPQVDGRLALDAGVAVDLGEPDIGTAVDVAQVDTADGLVVDAAVGTGGAAGSAGGAVGSGGAVSSGGALGSGGSGDSGGTSVTGGTMGSGGAVGSGGTSSTGGAVGTGGATGAGGSTPDAAPDVPASTPDAACVSETDQQMCSRLGKNCGAVSAFDNCGQSRSIASCGTCAAAHLVCGTFTVNLCPTVCVFDQAQSTFDNCVFDP